MLRLFYRWLLDLHPRHFRERFAEEMMSIFDDVEQNDAGAKLVVDAFVSLVRQWTMRSECRTEQATVREPAGADGVPIFFTMGSYKPRKDALLTGVVVTWIVYSVLFFAVRHSKAHSMYLPHVTFESALGADVKPLTNTPQRSSAVREPLPTLAARISRSPSRVGSPAPGYARCKERTTQTALLKPRQSASVNASSGERQILAVEPPIQSTPQRILPTPGPRETLLSYVGTYTLNAPGSPAIVITVQGPELAVQFPGEPKYVLAQVDEGSFVSSGATNCRIDFVKVGKGAEFELHIWRNGSEFRGRRKRN